MRAETDRDKIDKFMSALGERVRGPGRIYITGGGTAVLYGWRETTIDLDVKADPEPPHFFEAIAELKESIDLNIELAAPDDFIPALPDWRERSVFIARRSSLDFYHYDFYAQALSKIERGHARDREDVKAMLKARLIERAKLKELFFSIEPELTRYPAIDPDTLGKAVVDLCHAPDDN